jgi:4-amino-4-deoxy-L-arabinose transferase-like glycosyltransferase
LFKHSRRLLSGLILGCLMLYFGLALTNQGFDADESQWIATSAAFEDFIHGRVGAATWDESYWTLTQPPLTRYVIGAGRRLGGYGAAELNQPWDFLRSPEDNIRAGALPGDDLLFWSRLPMALMAAVAIWLLWRWIAACINKATAIAMLALIVLNLYFWINLTRAMSEAPLLLCTMLGLGAANAAVASWRRGMPPRMIGWCVAAGLAGGLAGAAKLNGFAVVVAICLFLAIALMADSSQPRRQALAWAGLAGLTVVALALLVFVLVNPYLYPDPIGRTIGLFEYRVAEMQPQKLLFPESSITTWSARLRIVPVRILHTFALLRFPGAMAINGLLLLGGLALAGQRLWRWRRTAGLGDGFLLLILAMAATGGPSLLTPLDWDRYYLFPILWSSVLMAMAIAWLARRLYAATTARRAQGVGANV